MTNTFNFNFNTYSSGYIVYTCFLLMLPFGAVILIILQTLSNRYARHKVTDKVIKILLYGVYISAFICGVAGFLLHHSRDNPLWCKFYGLPPCFGAYGATKAFLLGFFVRRARTANVTDVDKNIYKRLCFDRIAPIYISLYWIAYCVITALLFTGTYIDPEENTDKYITSYCLFNSWALWFIITADIVDIFNCISALLLFLIPLLRATNRHRKNEGNNHLLSKFILVMKWNTALSFVATLSSVITLTVIPIAKGYIWLWCIGDPLVNSVCAFIMMGSNRRYIRDKCCYICGYAEINEVQTTTSHIVSSGMATESAPAPVVSFSNIDINIVIKPAFLSTNSHLNGSMADKLYSQSGFFARPLLLNPQLKLKKSNSY